MRNQALASDLAKLLDDRGAIVSADDQERYERGYRHGAGRAALVARPATVDAVSALSRYCFRQDLRIVVQGAHTGLVGAGTPDMSGEQIVLSTERLRGSAVVDPLGRNAVALAGTRLSELNAAAGAFDLCLPIDLGADPSIGGMVATNTGGARLLRYGDMQRNLLGLEVVLVDADGTLLSDMTGLRKDNSGVDLKQLFVGTSGAFGIVTRACVELHQLPKQVATALVVPANHAAVPDLITRLERSAGSFLTACEGMSSGAMAAALRHNPRLRNPFPGAMPDYAMLVELTSEIACDDGVDLHDLLMCCLSGAMQEPAVLIVDALFGRPEDLWALRHGISEGLRAAGRVIAFDIALPRGRLPRFREEAVAVIGGEFDFLRVCDFGHCGDGGDHFNLLWPNGGDVAVSAEAVEEVRQRVYELVAGFGGTFSAEHGVGPSNAVYYRRFTAPAERSVASRLKALLDPKGLLGNVDFA